mmetsp:Transcript_15596/g.47151  ORF Transcript_15596/g.47151 Transcript_15596/m.47151 type:complete len:393 (+) Transcript_15596:36-1214(+)
MSSVLAPRFLHVGGGSVGKQLADVVGKSLGRRKPLIVTDEFLATKTDTVSTVAQTLSTEAVFTKTVPDPTTQSVGLLVDHLKSKDYDCIVAVGGGSPMDSAKAAAALVEFGGKLRDYKAPYYEGRELTQLPIVAIPTTAGTGSEVTKFTVVTDSESGEKMLCVGNCYLPAAAIVDYELTMTAPPRLTADTGIDAICHAMEAYVSKKNNWYSDGQATSALSAAGASLRNACQGDRQGREAMMRAATQAGLAFSNSSVTLIHGMSRPLGAHFHVPHGLSNAMLAPEVTAYSLAGATERYADVARALLSSASGQQLPASLDDDAACAAALPEALARLNEDLSVPTLAQFGVDKQTFLDLVPTMAKEALASGSPNNNPTVPSQADIEGLYRRIYGV